MTGIDLTVPVVIDFHLPDDPLFSRDALAETALRLPSDRVEHHLGDMPRVSPEGRTKALPIPIDEAIRTIDTNGSWVMLPGLGSFPEYQPLMRRVGAPLQLALRAAGEVPTAHDLIAFLAAPGAAVPIHYDGNHHLLVQVEGTKTVGIGYFDDEEERDRQIVRGFFEYRLNVDREPDRADAFVIGPGQALVIPAFAFHWVVGGDEPSVALTYVVGTEHTTRRSDAYRVSARSGS